MTVNVPRLLLVARTLLGYSDREAKMLLITEVCEGIDEYRAMNGIKTQDDIDIDDEEVM